MSSSRLLRLGLALAGLCVLEIAARPAAAQNLLYTLSNVTFADGATATGFFNANPTTGVFGNLDIITTSGLTGGLPGTHYAKATTSPNNSPFFAFSFTSGLNQLVLSVSTDDRIPGTQPLQPGSSSGPFQLTNSGEATRPVGGSQAVRVISSGSLIATAAPVPEASTTASLGLLLALGLGGLVIAKRRRKAARPTA